MNLLAIDTSTTACVVGLKKDAQLFSKSTTMVREHNQIILSFIQDILQESSLKLNDIDGFIWSCGPGSFTGLRLSAGIVQAFAYSTQKPVVAISSLKLLAQTAYEHTGKKKITVLQDARMQKIYMGKFFIDESGFANPIETEKTLSWDEIDLKEDEYIVGDAVVKYAHLISPNLKIDKTLLFPSPNALFTLGEAAFEQGLSIDAFSIKPNYQSHLIYKKVGNSS